MVDYYKIRSRKEKLNIQERERGNGGEKVNDTDK
jgi:hypothetical protein